MQDGLTEEEKVSRLLYSSPEVLVEYDRVGFCPEEERLVTRYFSNKNAKILDIGCGLGRTTQPLSDMGFEVIGIDVSEAMVNKARTKFPTIDFRIGDACDLQFGDEAFEYALFSFNGIDHIHPERRRIQALREIHRVLKPGGLFLFSSHNSWSTDVIGGLLGKDILWRSVLSKYFLRSKYLKSKTRYGEFALYFINPLNQKKQLQQIGFACKHIVASDRQKSRYFDSMPYYVAQKSRVPSLLR